MTNSNDLIARRRAVVAPGGGMFAGEMTAVSASGACIIDADGREFIDFAGGIGVMKVGHCNPAAAPKACWSSPPGPSPTSFERCHPSSSLTRIWIVA